MHPISVRVYSRILLHFDEQLDSRAVRPSLVDDHNLQLNCLVLGDDPCRMFKVRIAETAGVSDLRKLIKQKTVNTFRGVDAKDLDLHDVSLPIDNELDEKLERLMLNVPLHPVRKLSTCFVQPPEGYIHILVKKSGPPRLTGSATSKKCEHPEDTFDAMKRTRRTFASYPLQTPSSIAMPLNFQEHYQKKHNPPIRCGRPDENQSPFPLVLAHPIFSTFVSECETYQPNDEDLKFVLKLSRCMCQFYEDETDRRMQFRGCMREYGINLTEAKIEGVAYTTDGDARMGALPYLISEAKKDFGAAKGDPYIQTAAHHLAATQLWLRKHPDEPRALPCIHIFYSGTLHFPIISPQPF